MTPRAAGKRSQGDGQRAESGVIRFEVPRLPVPAPRARSNGAQRYHEPRYKAWTKDVKWMAHDAMPNEWKGGIGPPLKGDVRLSVVVHGAYRRGDGDNILKGIADALTGLLWIDDVQVRDWRIVLLDGKKAERRTVIEVSSMEKE